MEDLFLGEPPSYWLELKRQLELQEGSLDIKHLIRSNAVLLAKVSYYEARVKDMLRYQTVLE